MYRLQFHAAGSTTSFDEQRVLRIGSDQGNDIVLNAAGVSPRHAELRPTPPGWELYDVGSSEGTWVGEHRVGQVPLGPMTSVRFGGPGTGIETTIVVDSSAGDAATDPAHATAPQQDPERTVLPT